MVVVTVVAVVEVAVILEVAVWLITGLATSTGGGGGDGGGGHPIEYRLGARHIIGVGVVLVTPPSRVFAASGWLEKSCWSMVPWIVSLTWPYCGNLP